MRRIAGYMTTLLLGAGCFICLAQTMLYGQTDTGKDTCILQTEALPDETGESEFLFTLWGESKNVPITVPNLNRAADASLITVSGNSDLVMSGSRILDSGDTKSCLIDEKVSMELYGSTAICGEKLMIGSREYEVAGILYGDSGTVLVQADQDTKAVLDRASLRISDEENVQETIRRFSSSTGLQGIRIPLHLYGILTRGLLRILISLTLFLLLFRIFVKIRAYGSIKSIFLLLILVLLSAGACIWIIDLDLHIPRDMLPSKWSDLEFWSDLLKQKTEEISLLWTTEKSTPELHYFMDFLKSVLSGLGAALLGTLFLIRVKIKNLCGLAAMTVFFLLLSFSFAVFYVPDGSALVQERVFWLFFPLCFWLKYLDATVHSIL